MVPVATRRDDGVVAELLPGGRVGDVHLDQRRGALGDGVAQGVRVVRERGRVQHDGHAAVGGLVQPADQLGLVVGLADLDVQAEAARPASRHSAARSSNVVRAVDVRLAGAQPAEVRPVQDEHLARPPAHSAATSRTRGRAAPPSGPSSRPGSARPSRTTKRSVAPRAFLSMRIASRSSGQRRRRTASGRPDGGEDRAVPLDDRRREPAGQAGQLGGVDHADGDGVAVPEPVALDLLDRVGERVAVVEDLPQAALAQVGRHDAGLDRIGALDQLAGVRAVGAARRPPGRPRPAPGSRGSAMKPALITSARPLT